jgi:hypothetical protein
VDTGKPHLADAFILQPSVAFIALLGKALALFGPKDRVKGRPRIVER